RVRANARPDDWLRDAIHRAARADWIASAFARWASADTSSLSLLAMTAKSVADPNFMMLRLVAALPINRHGLQARSIHFLAKPLGLISADRHRCASLGIS